MKMLSRTADFLFDPRYALFYSDILCCAPLRVIIDNSYTIKLGVLHLFFKK